MYWLNEILQWSAVGVLAILWWLEDFREGSNPDDFAAGPEHTRRFPSEQLVESCKKVKDLGPSL